VLSTAGQYNDAVQQLKQMLAIDPQYAKTHETLGAVYLRNGMYKEAIAEYKANEQYGGGKVLGALGYAYARSGHWAQALRILDELQQLQKRSPSGDVFDDLALVEIGLAENDKAVAWLQKEYERHDNDGPLYFNVDPIFAPLQSDLRFQDMLRRMMVSVRATHLVKPQSPC
jgi:tetratricopeptide (TPR) repeat protein